MNRVAWKLSTATTLIGASAFVIISILLVFSEAVYIPYWDQWDLYRRYLSGREGAVSLAVTPINGHLVALPSVFFRADMMLFGAANVANLVILLASLGATCALLVKSFTRLAAPAGDRTHLLFAACTATLMVWYFHWENLFWPLQAQLYMSIGLAVAGMYALASFLAIRDGRPPTSAIALAIVAGLLSSVSFGSGLGFWGAALAAIMASGRDLRWKAGAAFTIGGIVTAFALLTWSALPADARNIDLGALVHFFVTYIGSPVLHGGNTRVLVNDARILSPVIGAGYLGVAMGAVIAYRLLVLRRRRPLTHGELFFVAVAAFSLTNAALTALARSSGALPSAALASRYGVLCMLYWIALVPLALSTFAPSRDSLRKLESVVPILLLTTLVVSQSAYLRWWESWRSLVEWAQSSLVTGVPDPTYLGYVYLPDRTATVESVAELLVAAKVSPIYHERTRYLGHAIGEFGPVDPGCPGALVDAVNPLPKGIRLTGRARSSSVPFLHRRVLVTDAGGTVIGIGAVERRWAGLLALLDGGVESRWVAYAPVADADAVRIFVSRSSGWCAADPLRAERVPGR